MENKRFFAFGCSFTRYMWPTWADLVATKFNKENYYNYGSPGSGNIYIHNCLMYADQFHKINKDDLVIICWSSFNREDVFVKGKWVRLLDRDGAIDHWDNTGYLIRDISLIKSAKIMLDHIGCNYYFLSLEDINKPYPAFPFLLNFYSDVVSSLIGNSYENMFGTGADIGLNRDLPVTQMLVNIDPHPLVNEHFQYIQSKLPKELLPDPLLVDDLYKKTLELLDSKIIKSNDELWKKFEGGTGENYWNISLGGNQTNKIYEDLLS